MTRRLLFLTFVFILAILIVPFNASARRGAGFKHADKNKDGVVDQAEAEAFAQEMKKRMEQMQRQMGQGQQQRR